MNAKKGKYKYFGALYRSGELAWVSDFFGVSAGLDLIILVIEKSIR